MSNYDTEQVRSTAQMPLAMGPVSSDNRLFATAGLPAVGIATGAASSHTPADVSERVEHEVMRMVGYHLASGMVR
jgi:hypothetical protein